jgi:putative transcriptional regulator
MSARGRGHYAGMDESLKGKLLVASPAIEDPHFRRTVVLMAEHGEDGAMGLVLNRAISATVSEAVPDLAWVVGLDAPVHEGGPVAAQSVVVLAEFDDPGSLGETVRRARVFAGHAGWGPGQLEAEMEEESWIVVGLEREDVFSDDPDELWSAVLRRQGAGLALLATMPADPSLN